MIRIKPVDRWNWESVAELKLKDSQKPFLQTNLFVLARAAFEALKLWAIYHGNILIGMAATACWTKVHWIPHFMIDMSFQNKGYGKEALFLILEHLMKSEQAFEFRASIADANEEGKALFKSCGFKLDGNILDESVYVLKF